MSECIHEEFEPRRRHVWDSAVPIRTLVEQGELSCFGGVGFEGSVEPTRFACSTEECEQSLSDGGEKKEPVTPFGASDVSGGKSHAEVIVFDVAKGFFDGETLGIKRDDGLGIEVDAVGGQAPSFFHAFLMFHDDSTDGSLVLGEGDMTKHLGVPGRRDPIGSELACSLVGDGDVLTKTDDEGPTVHLESGEELLVSKASVGEQGDVDVFRQDLVQSFDQLQLVAGASMFEFALVDGFPKQGCGSSVGGDHVHGEGGVIVSVEFGPIECDDDLFAFGDNEANPWGKPRPDRDAAVAEHTVDLFDGVFGVASDGVGQTFADGVDSEGSAMQDAEHTVGKGCDAIGVNVVAEHLLDEVMHLSRGQFGERQSRLFGAFFKWFGSHIDHLIQLNTNGNIYV